MSRAPTRSIARLSEGLGLAVLVGLVLSGAFPARAQTGPAPDQICLRFDGPWAENLTTIVESDLRTAFGRRRVQVELCRDAGVTGAVLTLAIASETLDGVTLTLGRPDGSPISRRVELGAFPADGRVLAVVVAADELLQASRERLGAPKPAAAPSPGDGVPTVAVRAREPSPIARGALAVAFSLERYGGGQLQLGPDLAGRLALGRRWFVLAAGQARQGLSAGATDGTIASRLLGGRLALGAVLLATAGERVALSAEAGARLGRLRFEGRPVAGSGTVGEATDAWLAYADATLAFEARVAGPLALRLGAGLGIPLLEQAAAQTSAADTTRTVTAASGLALQASAGAVLLF